MKQLTPAAPSRAGSVRAKTRYIPAFPMPVMNTFGPVQHELIAVALGGRLQGGRVGAGGRFGEREGAQDLAPREAGKPLPLLVLIAEEQDRLRSHRVVDVDEHRGAGAGGRDLLDADREGEVVEPGAAVLGRNEDSHQVELGRGAQDLGRETTLVVGAAGQGLDDGGGELAHRLPQLPVRGGRVGIHVPPKIGAQHECWATLPRRNHRGKRPRHHRCPPRPHRPDHRTGERGDHPGEEPEGAPRHHHGRDGSPAGDDRRLRGAALRRASGASWRGSSAASCATPSTATSRGCGP